MNNKFDAMAKGLAQSVTRRSALKKFSLGLAGLVLAALALPNKAEAAKGGKKGKPIRYCTTDADCHKNEYCGYRSGADAGEIGVCISKRGAF